MNTLLSLTNDEEISVYLPVYQKVETRRHYEGEVGYVGQQLQHLIVMMMIIIVMMGMMMMMMTSRRRRRRKSGVTIIMIMIMGVR